MYTVRVASAVHIRHMLCVHALGGRAVPKRQITILVAMCKRVSTADA